MEAEEALGGGEDRREIGFPGAARGAGLREAAKLVRTGLQIVHHMDFGGAERAVRSSRQATEGIAGCTHGSVVGASIYDAGCDCRLREMQDRRAMAQGKGTADVT